MISSDILSKIRQEKQRIISQKQNPIAVKMNNATWDVLADSDLAQHFGDVQPHKCLVLDMMVMKDNALPDGVIRVYTDWATAIGFSYA